MRSKTFVAIYALACLGTTSACARFRSGSTGAAPAPVITRVEVDNRGYLDMNVYVMRDGGAQRRLGTALGNSTTTLTIPQTMLSGATSLKFLADPIGGRRTSVSSTIIVNPGDIVTLRIPSG
jgi:hypothetical protein